MLSICGAVENSRSDESCMDRQAWGDRATVSTVHFLEPALSPHHPNPAMPDADAAIAELRSYQWALDQQSIVGVTDRRGTITYVNELFCKIAGYQAEELVGRTHGVLNSGYHPRDFFHDMWRTISSGKGWHGEICNRAKDGSLYWVDTTIVPKFNTERKIEGYVSVRYDITQRKLAQQALVEENERRLRAEMLLRDIIETLPNGVSAFDDSDRLILFNSAFRECYPSVASEIQEGATFREILGHAADNGEFAQVSGSDDASLEWIEARVATHRNPGRPFIQELSGDRWLKVHERRSSAGYVVGVRTDVTDLKRAERHVKLQAETDPLTGLANRRVLIDQLTTAITSRRRSDRTNALVLIDLDGFKPINDALGHDAGDILLVEVARRIRQTVRKSDLVSRLGGDEYAVLLMDVLSETNAERIVRKLLAEIKEPFRIGRQTIRISASFGIALFPKGASTPLDVMKHADVALYKAKQDGRSTWAVYSGAMRKQVKRRDAMTRALQRAIEKEEIRVALQPQLRVADHAHCGFEALARWNWKGNWVSPLDLIALAEESGLIAPLGDAILSTTFRTVRAMKAQGLWLGKISVNLAAAQLRDPVFAKRFLDTLASHGLEEREFAVEITENVMLDRQADTIRATLNVFMEAGVRIGLDDFGTGYGSLAHLQRFPISFLKIDRSFVSELSEPDGNAVIAGSIVSLAHSLNMWVVAEGIETQAQFDRLRAMGTDYVQGFLFAKPMFENEAAAYLASASSRAA